MSLVVDIILGVLLAWCTLLGAYWGMLRQVLAVLGVLAAIALAGLLGPVVGDWLTSFSSATETARALGAMLVVLAASATISLLATLVRNRAGLLLLTWIDLLVGGLLGAVQGWLLASALVALAARAPAEPAFAGVRASFLSGLVQRFGLPLVQLLLG